MHLSKALGVKRGDVLSLVGAGGKTTTMHRLAAELAQDGWRVVCTTTTMIRTEQGTEHTIVESEPQRLLQAAQRTLERHNQITVASGFLRAQGKLKGVGPSIVDSLAALPTVDAVLVEADGAKGRSLKAPAAHEPVIPARTSVLVPVAGLDALGQELGDSIAHRPEIVSAVLDIQQGDLITADTIARLLLHVQGGMKSAPRGARVLPLLNKVTERRMKAGRDIARQLLQSQRVQRVLLGAVAETDPIKEAWGHVAAIVLAAGESRRFGSPKQLLSWGDKTLLEHVVDTVLASSVGEVVVVLGHRAHRVVKVLQNRPLTVVTNSDWKVGMSSSVRAALHSIAAGYEACLFLLGDQPNVTAQLIDSILERYHRSLASIVAPSHRGHRGNPVLFNRSLFPELLALEGDQGGREVIRRHEAEMETVEVEDESVFLDIDTVDDLNRAG